jgi:hypothetical protein
MPEDRSESNSESNKKKLIHTLVHFEGEKTADTQKYINNVYVYLIAHLMLKRLSFIFLNPLSII